MTRKRRREYAGGRQLLKPPFTETINNASRDLTGLSVQVTRLADLPAPVDGVIHLEPGVYDVLGQIDIGDNKLSLTAPGNYTLRGQSRIHTSISSSNADEALISPSGGGSFRMKDIALSNSVGNGATMTSGADFYLSSASVTTTNGTYGILSSASLMTLHDCIVRGGTYGLQCTGTAIRMQANMTQFRAGTDAGDRALYYTSAAVNTYSLFTNCRFRQGGDHNILLETGGNYTIPVHFVACVADAAAGVGLDDLGEDATPQVEVANCVNFV